MPGTLDIDLLRSLVAVAETGALSKAADRVGRTQSALSMQMQRLEEVAGQPLLHRTGRGVTLTAAGERLLQHAGELMRRHDEALAELRGVRMSGVLRFACPEDYAVHFLPPLLESFASLHPRVQLEVVCAPSPRLVELLARHTVDLALVSAESAQADAVIRHEPLVWVARRGAGLTEQSPLPLALGAPDALDHVLALQALGAAGRGYRLAYASSSLTGLLAMARSGQALTVLTRTAVPDDLEILDDSRGLPPLPSVALTLAFDRPQPTPLTAAFAAHVRQRLKSA